MEVSEVTVTVTETEQHDEIIENTEFSTSVDPITVMSTVTETLVVSETETIEGDIESVFATVTVNSYNHPEERQSRYNSKGSYVGYI
ncbi:hypothetical protein H4R23_002582 [Coemansia sp. Cherry 401B]|nr:hypothetical protein H4R23_002582 [Coemansia sp. Cherry 401B]